jgi:hypothetical protein
MYPLNQQLVYQGNQLPPSAINLYVRTDAENKVEAQLNKHLRDEIYHRKAVRKICYLLNLDSQAGIGLRLAALHVWETPEDSNIFYIRSKCDPVEAQNMAETLSISAQRLALDIMFIPIRISNCRLS